MARKKPNKRLSKKVGRNGNGPAHKRYVAEQRWLVNKQRNIERVQRKHPAYRP